MQTSAFFKLLVLNLNRNRKQLLLSSLGIVIGITSFLFFLSLGYGVRTLVTQDVLGALPVNQVEVIAKSYALGMFRVQSFFQQGVTEQALEKFRKMQSVRRVYGKMNLKVPARAVVPIPSFLQKKGMTSSFYTELVGQGLDPKVAKHPGKGPLAFRFHPPSATSPSTKATTIQAKSWIQCGNFRFSKKPIPILISRRLLDLYNSTLAGARGFPKLNASFIKNVKFHIYLGRSALQRRESKVGTCHFPARVVGVSKHAILLGATMPLAYVQRFNAIFRGERVASTYQSAVIETHQARDVPVLLRKLEKMGFTLERGQIFAKKVGEMVFLFALVLTLISVIIMLIAAISIGHTFFMFVQERRYQIGLMRAVGATQSFIRRLVLCEAIVVGLFTGILAIIFTRLGVMALEWSLRYSERLPFKAEKLFAAPWWLPWSALFFSVFFCLLGAFFPARRAAKLDPAKILSQN